VRVDRDQVREHRQVEVVRRQLAAEQRACRDERVPELDARLRGLILEDREREGSECVARRGGEVERHLRAVAREDAVAALRAVVGLHRGIDLCGRIVQRREVVPVTGLALEADDAPQRTDARVERPVQRLGSARAVDRL